MTQVHCSVSCSRSRQTIPTRVHLSTCSTCGTTRKTETMKEIANGGATTIIDVPDTNTTRAPCIVKCTRSRRAIPTRTAQHSTSSTCGTTKKIETIKEIANGGVTIIIDVPDMSMTR